MSKFNVNDCVVITGFFGSHDNVKNGNQGLIVKVSEPKSQGQTYDVFFPKSGGRQEVHEDFMKIDENNQPKVIHHVSTDYGFTESFDEKTIKNLCRLHLIFHNRTVVLDGVTRKIYSNLYDTNYKVEDKRTKASLTLEQQYPRDLDY